jgi:hypothetical protein
MCCWSLYFKFSDKTESSLELDLGKLKVEVKFLNLHQLSYFEISTPFASSPKLTSLVFSNCSTNPLHSMQLHLDMAFSSGSSCFGDNDFVARYVECPFSPHTFFFSCDIVLQMTNALVSKKVLSKSKCDMGMPSPYIKIISGPCKLF